MKAVLATLSDFQTIAAPNGTLPWMEDPEVKKADMLIFKECTMGKDLLMGRHTWEVDLKGKPLPGRGKHYVLTSGDLESGEAVALHGLEEVESLGPEVICIGGKSVYDAVIPLCSAVTVDMIKLPGEIPADGVKLQGNLLETLYKSGFVYVDAQRLHESVLRLDFIKPLY